MTQRDRNNLITNIIIFTFFLGIFGLFFITEAKSEQDLLEERQRPIFNLKVTMSSVNIRQGPGTSYMWRGTVKKNDLLNAFKEKDGWYHCKTPDGKEGWIIASACKILPIRSESAHSELRRVITNCETTHVRAGPVDIYPALGMLSMDREVGMYLEEEEWIYIKENKEGLEGWIKKKCVYDIEKHVDLIAWKEEALSIAEKLSNYYDQKKKETRAHQDAGWYPSFSVFLREKDIAIEPLLDEWKLDLALSLRKISTETIFPLPTETVPIRLSESDRLFFMLLFQTLIENDAYNEVKIRLKGLKKKSGSLKWTEAESYTLKRSNLEGKDLDKLDTNEFWDLLIQNKN
jgi:SH3-like domain-containing protein